ncbi:hypothetical protein ACFLSE_05770 [Bacteroidota bacterium]
MFNSTILEVVIGLVFLYLLFSLLATIVNEIFSTFLKFRARNLKRAIKNMMDKDSEEGRELFKKIHKHPMIQSFLKRKGRRFPSYIEPKKFVKVILEIYNEDKLSEASAEIKETVEKLPEQNYLRHILLSHIEKSEKLTEEFKNDVKKLKESLIDLKNNLEKSIEDWFNSVMERTAGWYNRTNKIWTLVIALVIAIMFNFDSIHVYNRLSKDSKARKSLVSYAEKNIDKYAEYIKIDTTDERTDSALIAKMDSLKGQINTIIDEEITSIEGMAGIGWKLPEKFEMNKKIVLCIDSLGVKKVECNTNCILFEVIDTAQLKEIASRHNLNLKYFNRSFSHKENSHIDTLNKEDIKADTLFKNCIPKYLLEKDKVLAKKTTYIQVFRPWKYKIQSLVPHFWGYLLTALAISLGAPFWFDILNKVMKLRGTGKKEEVPNSST